LKEVFDLLGESVTADELQSKLMIIKCLAMIKIASQKSGQRITFKDFVDFFYKAD